MNPLLSRRGFLATSGVLGAGAALGCATGGKAGQCPSVLPSAAAPPVPTPWAWNDDEAPLVFAERPDFDIVTRGSQSARVLRQRTRLVDKGVDLSTVAKRMETTMLAAKGVGLAGPQVGLNIRVAMLMLDYKSDKPRVQFFRNPLIVERSDDSIEGYEGCLSIPNWGGMVRRSRFVRVSHDTLEGETLSEEAEGYNAVLWQHELDHLEGILYVDKLIGELLPMDEVRRLRKEMDEKNSAPKPPGSALFSRPYTDVMIA